MTVAEYLSNKYSVFGRPRHGGSVCRDFHTVGGPSKPVEWIAVSIALLALHLYGTFQDVKLGHFGTAKPRVRAACLSLWILFLWLFPVVLSATTSAEEGHACCRRTKHSCCKKSGKGAAIGSRPCGMSCPALEKFQTGPAPALPEQGPPSFAHHTPQPAARMLDPLTIPTASFSTKQHQRPPPAV